MKVSVIIPTYNRTDKLERAVKSIVDQNLYESEVIVVDDGSDEETLEFYNGLCKRYPIGLYYREKGPKGANMCRSIGFNQAKGIYIKWLDSDDELVAGSLAKQVHALESGNYDVSTANAAVYDWRNGKEGQYIKNWAQKIQEEDMFSAYVKGEVRWPTGSPLWRKDFFASAPFDPKQLNSQEWLMHCQAIAKGPRIHYMEEPAMKVHIGNDRLSSYINRSAGYFYNQAMARVRLLKSIKVKGKLKLVLYKFMVVYFFHAFYRKVFGKPFK